MPRTTTRRPRTRGVIQVGNPFLGKLLIEASQELVESGRVLALQDLGAAGLTSSAAKGRRRAAGLGWRSTLRSFHAANRTLTPFEVMLSESQERMLVLVTDADVEHVHEVCRRHRAALHADRSNHG